MADLTSQIQELGRYGDSVLDLGFTTATEQNNTISNDGNTELFFENTHATLSRTVTITSIPDQFGRSGDIVLVIPALQTARTGFLPPNLFDGTMAIDVSSDFIDIDIGAFRLTK